MPLLSSFNEGRPVTYFRGHPIYYATLLTIAYSVGVVLTFLAKASGHWSLLVAMLALDSSHSILSGRLWQVVTYSFIDFPSFFTILGLLFLYISAVEVEKYIGKTRFLTLYGIILLIPVVSLTAVGMVLGYQMVYFGNTEVAIGLFIAFCTLYPGVQWFGFITAKWLAIASLALATLSDMAAGAYISVGELWLICSFSFGYIRFLQRGGELPSFSFPSLRRRPKLRVVPRSRPQPTRKPASEPTEIDSLLDKISQHGLSSLSPEERAALERARAKLLEKDRK